MNKDFYQIGDDSNNDEYFIFSTLIAYTSHLSLFADTFEINNTSGPYSFVYETLFGHVVETEAFDDLKDPNFTPERACVTLRGSCLNVKKFFGLGLQRMSDDCNEECFDTLHIYLKAVIRPDIVKPKFVNAKINVGKTSINLNKFYESTSYNTNFAIDYNDILIKIEDEVQLSPLIYNNNDRDLQLPIIGITILLQKVDRKFLPDFYSQNTFLATKSMKSIEVKDCSCDKFKNIVKQNEKLIKKRKRYEKLINHAKKCIVNLLEKGEHNVIYDENKDQGILYKMECLEQKLLDMEKDLNKKTVENIDLSQKIRHYENTYGYGQTYDSTIDLSSPLYKPHLLNQLNFVTKDHNTYQTQVMQPHLISKPSNSEPLLKKLSQSLCCEVDVAEIKAHLEKPDAQNISTNFAASDQLLQSTSIPKIQIFDDEDPYIKLCKSFDAMTKSFG